MLTSVPIREVQTGSGQSIRYVLASDIPPGIGKRYQVRAARAFLEKIGVAPLQTP